MDNVLMTEVFVLSKPDESCLLIENQKSKKSFLIGVNLSLCRAFLSATLAFFTFDCALWLSLLGVRVNLGKGA